MTYSHLETIYTANDLDSSYRWIGFDYIEHMDRLVFHAQKLIGRRIPMYSHLVLHRPYWLMRPAILGYLEFGVDVCQSDISLVSLSSQASIVAYRDPTAWPEKIYYASCYSMDFVNNDDDNIETSMESQLYSLVNVLRRSVLRRGTVTDCAAVLRTFDETRLHWRHMSSSLSCEFVISSDDESLPSIVLALPFFVSLPKVMSSVALRPGSVDDATVIEKRLGARIEDVLGYPLMRAVGLIDNLLVIECDEGVHYVYCKGAEVSYVEIEQAKPLP